MKKKKRHTEKETLKCFSITLFMQIIEVSHPSVLTLYEDNQRGDLVIESLSAHFIGQECHLLMG